MLQLEQDTSSDKPREGLLLNCRYSASELSCQHEENDWNMGKNPRMSLISLQPCLALGARFVIDVAWAVVRFCGLVGF